MRDEWKLADGAPLDVLVEGYDPSRTGVQIFKSVRTISGWRIVHQGKQLKWTSFQPSHYRLLPAPS